MFHNAVTHRSLKGNAVASNDITQLPTLCTEFQWCLAVVGFGDVMLSKLIISLEGEKKKKQNLFCVMLPI